MKPVCLFQGADDCDRCIRLTSAMTKLSTRDVATCPQCGAKWMLFENELADDLNEDLDNAKRKRMAPWMGCLLLLAFAMLFGYGLSTLIGFVHGGHW